MWVTTYFIFFFFFFSALVFIVFIVFFMDVKAWCYWLNARIILFRSPVYSIFIYLCTVPNSNWCSILSSGPKGEASLTVIHKYGPCFQSNKEQVQVLNHTEILLQDQSRVNSIHSMFSKNSDGNKLRESQATTIPAKSGLSIGFGNYIVTVGLGTPKTDQTLVFDTGSDLTWAQCEPCARQCYKQVDPIFDPYKSTSYTNISCPTPLCAQLTSAIGKPYKYNPTQYNRKGIAITIYLF